MFNFFKMYVFIFFLSEVAKYTHKTLFQGVEERIKKDIQLATRKMKENIELATKKFQIALRVLATTKCNHAVILRV